MSRRKPRTPVGPASPQERDWGFAAVAFLTACAVLTWLLFGVADDPFQSGGRPIVTVQGVPAGSARSESQLPVGSVDPGDTPGRRLGDGLVLAPRMIEGRIAGYAIGAESDPASLSAARLRAGDVLIDMDGRPLDSGRIQALGDEISVADSIEVTFLRDGRVRKRLIDLSG